MASDRLEGRQAIVQHCIVSHLQSIMDNLAIWTYMILQNIGGRETIDRREQRRGIHGGTQLRNESTGRVNEEKLLDKTVDLKLIKPGGQAVRGREFRGCE
jgi:hypothetical protein